MPLVYGNAASALGLAPPNIATYQSTMFGLMLRNVATTGWVLTDPSGTRSRPGAIIASPSCPANTTDTTQNYVYNWTRDAAITAFEVAAAPAPWTGIATFDDYVSFAQTCQAASVGPVPISRAASAAVALLRTAGDKMLQALIYHSDFLELSEQFDGSTGYEKSVRNLTWSYAAFLSALRARP